MSAETPLRTSTAEIQADNLDVASQWRLMWLKFKRHRLAVISAVVLVIVYSVGLFAEFLAPNDPHENNRRVVHAPPKGFVS